MPPFSHGHRTGKVAKPKYIKKTIKRLFSYFGSYKFRLTIVLLCIVLASTTTIASSILSSAK